MFAPKKKQPTLADYAKQPPKAKLQKPGLLHLPGGNAPAPKPSKKKIYFAE